MMMPAVEGFDEAAGLSASNDYVRELVCKLIPDHNRHWVQRILGRRSVTLIRPRTTLRVAPFRHFLADMKTRRSGGMRWER